MTRREKIILTMASLAAVYALGSGLWGGGSSGPSRPSDKQPGMLAKVDALAKQVAGAAPTTLDRTMLAAIDAPWRTASVYDRPLAGKAKPTKAAALPHYTGYVELGSGRLAVVDGYEYQAGDDLEGGGYKVVAISPAKVILESLANGNRVELPYEGLEAQ